jgi:hypothetical protein
VDDEVSRLGEGTATSRVRTRNYPRWNDPMLQPERKKEQAAGRHKTEKDREEKVLVAVYSTRRVLRAGTQS